MNTNSALNLYFLICFGVCLGFSTKAEVKIISGEHSIILDKSNSELKPLWKVKTGYDDLSLQDLTYKGYDFTELLKYLQQKWKLSSVVQIKVKAKDGYILNLPADQFDSPLSFLALDVFGLPEKGLYVKDFKYHVDWKAGYLVLNPKKCSNPYQVIEIELLTKVNPRFSSLFPKKFQPAATVYATHCLKCHGYKDIGGFKGP